jgi:DNA-binding transcriptional ArsR family regulator
MDSAPPTHHRVVDLDSLKALAHPLRIRIIDTLSTHGAFTASGLGERLGESSGAMSYHLRQLEKHDFIREVDGKGTGRERWWETIPGGIELHNRDVLNSEAGKQATRLVVREFSILKENALTDFLERGMEDLPEEWLQATAVSSAHVFVDTRTLKQFTERIQKQMREFTDAHRGKQLPGTRPVEIHFNAFPVMDGVELPLDSAGVDSAAVDSAAGERATADSASEHTSTGGVKTPIEGKEK